MMKNEFYVPAAQDVAFQSLDNKQGRSTDEISAALKEKVRTLLADEQNRVYENYSDLLEDNVARELARINLPLSLYTEWYWQMDLKNMFHFLKLRMDAHAQIGNQGLCRGNTQVGFPRLPCGYGRF